MTTRPTTILEMIERLIAFDTVSSKSNLALIDFVAESLESHGVVSRRSFDAEGGKANLYATLGPDIAGGVVLSGHSDVVPVENSIRFASGCKAELHAVNGDHRLTANINEINGYLKRFIRQVTAAKGEQP